VRSARTAQSVPSKKIFVNERVWPLRGDDSGALIVWTWPDPALRLIQGGVTVPVEPVVRS
jgi:hypothetical protein